MEILIDGLLQDCSNSIANALELLQSCTKPSLCRAGVKYVLSNTNTNTNTFFPEFQIQIQIHWQNLNKYKYKYSSSITNINTNTQWGQDKIAAILQMTYSNSLYCKKIVLFIQISLKIFSKDPIYNNPALVQIMAWHWVGNKPLSDQWWPGLHDAWMHHSTWMSKCQMLSCWLLFECGITSWANSVTPAETKTCTRSVTYFVTYPGNSFDHRATLSLVCIE